MGKGDKKSRRGKLYKGSYGVKRPRKKKHKFSVVSSTKPASKAVESAKATELAEGAEAVTGTGPSKKKSRETEEPEK